MYVSLHHTNTPVVHPVSSKGIRLPEVDLGGQIDIYCSFDGGFFFLVKKVQIEELQIITEKFLPRST